MSIRRRIAVKLELDFLYKRHTGIFAGVQKYVQEQGWESIVDEFVEDTLSRPRKAVPYDGVIARTTPKLAAKAAQLGLPLVNVWFSSPVAQRVPGVFEDSTRSGQLRAEHLISRGLSRFATLSSEQDRTMLHATRQFIQTVNEAGFECLEAMVSLSSFNSVKEWRKSERTINAWMNKWKPPIGVAIGSESHARMVTQYCLSRGWRVPQDVAIIAGRNEETLCIAPRPSLSSVEIGYDRIGYRAAQLLDKLMKGEPAPPEPILIPPIGIVVRESTDFFAVEDPVISAALRFIAENCHQKIGQDDVAAAVSTETRTLQRRFQKFLNRPIATEIRRVRIERAKRQLAESDVSIKEIAREVGFGTALRLYEIFRREMGITPSQYRRERQSQFEM